MWVYAGGSFAITLSNIFFWFLIFSQRHIGKLAKAYFWWSFYITLWSFGYGVTLSGLFSYEVTLVWNKYCQAMAMMIGPYFFRFGCFTANSFDQNKRIYRFYLLFGVINAAALFLTSYYVKGLWSFGVFRYQPLGGPLYSIFTAFFFWCTVHSFLVAAKALKSSSGLQREHIKLFLLGTGIAYSGGGALFLQAYRIPFPSYGVFPILAYVLIIGYAVHRYKFLDIPVLVRRTVVFTGTVAIAVSVVSIPFAITQLVIGKAIGIHPFVLMVSGIATTVLIYRPLARWLVVLTDKFLFQKKYDYRKLLKDASAGISQIKSLNQLLSLVTHFITMRVRVKSAAVIVRDEKNDYFKLAYLRGYSKDGWLRKGHIFNETDPLIDYLGSERQPIEMERVKEWAESSRGPRTPNHESRGTLDVERGMKKYDFQAIKERMTELQAACCVPSFLGEKLRNVLVLGEKKSGDFYTDEDLSVLYTLAQESAIAIENARLYDEAIEKAKELELINDELNFAQTKVLKALNDTELANKQLKRTQAELIEAKKRALLAGISAAVAHEIRNPLTPMLMRTYVLLKKLEDTNQLYYESLAQKMTEPERQRFLVTFSALHENLMGLQRSEERIKGIVNTLVNLVKERTEQKGEVQLKLLIASAVEEVRFQTYWETLSVPQIITDIPTDLPFIYGITQDLQGVFVNLIVNSYHAMEKSLEKRITIKAKTDPDNPKMIRIDFTDTGSGIPKELHDKIFEHGFTTKAGKGTGIGLFYCKDNVERVHGGSITINSELGVGTCFTIKLPIYEGSEEASGGQTNYGNAAHH